MRAVKPVGPGPVARCPTCEQLLTTGPNRWCARCERPIGNHHKWQRRADGRLEHKVCSMPDSYMTPEDFHAKTGTWPSWWKGCEGGPCGTAAPRACLHDDLESSAGCFRCNPLVAR